MSNIAFTKCFGQFHIDPGRVVTMCMPRLGLHLLPLSVFVLLPTTFITSYIIAVVLGHVEPGFPYISDTGTKSPESCIFGQLLNICAVLIGVTIYVRYEQVKDYNQHSTTLLRLNKVALVLGMLSALGMSLVGNFQETNVIVVHLIGAMMAFGLGAIYCWLQTYMSHHMVPHMNSRATVVVRLVVCFVLTIAFVLSRVFESLAKKSYHGNNPRKWYPVDGGFVWHVVSTVSEWLMAVAVLVFFTTFIHEFKQLSMTPPKIHFSIASRPSSPRHQGYSSVDDIVT